MQHYQFHIGDYRSATMHLSDDEDLAYRRLIDHYYDTERPIDLDTVKVARKIRCALAVVDQVLAEFFTRTEEGFKNFRCEEVIAKFYEKSEVGRKYAQARWDRVRSEKASAIQSEPNGYPMATHIEPNANPMLPVTRNPLPITQESKPLAPGDESPEAPKQKIFKPNGADQTPVIERIPLIGDVEFEIHQSSVLEWERLFPAVDVPQTLKEIRAWNLANPRNRKTPTGIMRHVTQWLAKEQNKPEPSQYQRR